MPAFITWTSYDLVLPDGRHGTPGKITVEPCLSTGAGSAGVAEEGLNLGVVTEIVPADQMETGAGEVAERLTHLAPLRLAATKELMGRIQATWAPHRVAGEDLILSCSRSDDFRGAVQAFVEKRKETWTGRQ